MAVAATIVSRNFVGLRKHHIVDLAFSGTYTTNGEGALTPWKDLELQAIEHVQIEQGGGVADGVIGKYDRSTNKIRLFRADQVDDFFEEVANGVSLTNVGTLRALFIGT